MLRISALPFIVAMALAAPTVVDKPVDPANLHNGDQFTATAERVHDGDTFWATVPDVVSHSIRIHGADTPEMERKGFWPTQPGAIEARDWLAKQIDGKQVTLTVKGKSYQRFVCTVHVGDRERDLGMELIERGLAWAAPGYATKAQKEAEQRARAAKVGLWKDGGKKPVAPWSWRKGER